MSPRKKKLAPVADLRAEIELLRAAIRQVSPGFAETQAGEEDAERLKRLDLLSRVLVRLASLLKAQAQIGEASDQKQSDRQWVALFNRAAAEWKQKGKP